MVAFDDDFLSKEHLDNIDNDNERDDSVDESSAIFALLDERMQYFVHEVLLSLKNCCSFCGKTFNSKPMMHKNLTIFLLNSYFFITHSFINLLVALKKILSGKCSFGQSSKTNTYIRHFLKKT